MKYPIYKPYLKENTKKYVNECIDSTWISSRGKFVELFENKISDYCETKYAASVFNGTVALHLALLSIDVGAGDEVIVPDFSYIATANAVSYTGAKPIFADVSIKDWNITLEEIKKLYNEKVKAIIVVDIYGTQPNELKQISEFAKSKKIYLIQDSAESLGSLYYNSHIAHFSDIATLSFFGNKTITTGEGGMILTNNKEIYEKVQVLKNQGNSKSISYFHDMLGYNYRMTNIQAAIGCSQIELIDEILDLKKHIMNCYREFLGDNVIFQEIDKNIQSSYWLVCAIINKNLDKVIKCLNTADIETRPFFCPMSSMPFYDNADCGVTSYISKKGICLPSYPELGRDDIKYICEKIIEGIGDYYE